MRIKIFRRSRATIVLRSHRVWRGVLRPPGQFETWRTSRADRRHVSIGTVRCGLVERSL
jgi:hypothetical protein